MKQERRKERENLLFILSRLPWVSTAYEEEINLYLQGEHNFVSFLLEKGEFK